MKIQPKTRLPRLLIIFIVIGLLGAAFGIYRLMESANLRAFDELYARWQDAEKVAGATARVGLALPVASLQALRREGETIKVPSCLTSGKPAMVEAMGHTVDGYVAFMKNAGNSGNVSAAIEFDSARQKFDAFKTARAACPRGLQQ